MGIVVGDVSGKGVPDLNLIAHRVAELSLNPGIIAQDGFLTSHVIESMRLPERELVKEFLGSPADIIESPTPAQRLIFGEKRRRIPEMFDLDYPAMLGRAAASLAPHDVAFYARSLASAFHSYYAAERFLVDDVALARARMALLAATAQVLGNALGVLGVSAPERMEREPTTETKDACFRNAAASPSD